MKITLVKAFLVLIPAALLFARSASSICQRRTAAGVLQLFGSACLMIVVLTHIAEALHLLSSSIGEIDFTSQDLPVLSTRSISRLKIFQFYRRDRFHVSRSSSSIDEIDFTSQDLPVLSTRSISRLKIFQFYRRDRFHVSRSSSSIGEIDFTPQDLSVLSTRSTSRLKICQFYRRDRLHVSRSVSSIDQSCFCVAKKIFPAPNLLVL